MAYRKNFQPGELIKSADQNNNFNTIQNGTLFVTEDLTSQINSTTCTFVVSSEYVLNSTKVYVDGIKLRRIVDYLESGVAKIMISPTSQPLIIGQDLVIDYTKKNV